MRTIRITVLILLCILWPQLLPAQEDITVRVAVLPLEIFSMEETSTLGRELAIQLSQQLSLNPRILTCSQDLIAPLLEGKKEGAPDLARMAQALDAHFIVSGSLTKIQNDMSMDVQLYNNFAKEASATTFAEGTGLETLVRETAQKLEQEIFKKAALIPQAQRIKTAEAPAPAVKSEEPIPEMLEEPKQEAPAPKRVEEKPPAEAVPPAPPEKEQQPAEEETAAEQPAAPEPEKKPELPPEETKAGKTARHADAGKEKKSGPAFGNSNLPVNIHADTLEYDNKQNQVAFNGHVVARQGDMVIFADAMKVDYEAKGKLRQIQARGGVKIIQGDRIATGDTITFYNEQQKIVLSGNPRVWQGDNVITGERITVYIKEERSVVEGTQAGRVSATIVPKKKEQKSAP
jgi:lipopolysaccharide export system protein LptA